MSEVRERPILFSGEMIRAILDGRKSQTRRTSGLKTVNASPDLWRWFENFHGGDDRDVAVFGHRVSGDILHATCPYGRRGGRLWVKETWATSPPGCPGGLTYRADHRDPRGDGPANPIRWIPSIHMPREASRILLEVTGTRVERLRDITEAAAKAEGPTPNWNGDMVEFDPDEHGFLPAGFSSKQEDDYTFYTARDAFMTIWDSINAKRGCGSEINPWVWVIEFRRVSS